MNYYERAQELNEETIANRRYFHTNAGSCLEIGNTDRNAERPEIGGNHLSGNDDGR